MIHNIKNWISAYRALSPALGVLHLYSVSARPSVPGTESHPRFSAGRYSLPWQDGANRHHGFSSARTEFSPAYRVPVLP